MAILHEYDWIFAFGTIFAFLDAWNIGMSAIYGKRRPTAPYRPLTELALAPRC
jgi:solute carrier family 20 (sodium-dependent phosphate transporter)